MSDVSVSFWKFPCQEIDFSSCEIEHYENNGGVVLREKEHGEVLVFIHCSMLGYTKEENSDEKYQMAIAEKADKIFSELVKVHNMALRNGFEKGENKKMAEIRKCIGVRG